MSAPSDRHVSANWNIPARPILASALVLFVAAYVIFLILGRVPENARIDFPTIMLAVITALAVVALINPKTQNSFVEIFGRVRSFQIADMRLELAEIRACRWTVQVAQYCASSGLKRLVSCLFPSNRMFSRPSCARSFGISSICLAHILPKVVNSTSQSGQRICSLPSEHATEWSNSPSCYHRSSIG